MYTFMGRFGALMMYESKQWQVRQEKLKKGSNKSKKNQNSATDRGEALAANSRAMCAKAMYMAAIIMLWPFAWRDHVAGCQPCLAPVVWPQLPRASPPSHLGCRRVPPAHMSRCAGIRVCGPLWRQPPLRCPTQDSSDAAGQYLAVSWLRCLRALICGHSVDSMIAESPCAQSSGGLLAAPGSDS